jgi:hypothetical protein
MANVPTASGRVGMPIRVDGRSSPGVLSQMVARDKSENQEMATRRA